MSETILITGAGGFIGGRIVEIAHSEGWGEIRAGVRRWGSSARIGRFPVDIVLCDVEDPEKLDAAMKGATRVVHCAYGSERCNVEGTRNVMEAALRHGVERVVHLSTIDVYGEVSGEVDETTPRRLTGRPYGDSKVQAEEICEEYVRRGLPVAVLRPTIVYGPFSTGWTMEFAERLQMRPWLLPEEDCEGTCNLVYVDDVAYAVRRALHEEGAVGQAFNVNGPDRVTWNDYFRALNREMGLPPLEMPSRAKSRLATTVMTPVRKAAKLLLNRYSDQIMGLYQRSDLAKAVMRRGERMIRQTPTTGEFVMYSQKMHFSTAKAAELIGYVPRFGMEAGVRQSVAWLRHHRLLRKAA